MGGNRAEPSRIPKHQAPNRRTTRSHQSPCHVDVVRLAQTLTGSPKQQLPGHPEVYPRRRPVAEYRQLLATTTDFLDRAPLEQEALVHARLGGIATVGRGPAPAAGRIFRTRDHISPMNGDADDSAPDRSLRD